MVGGWIGGWVDGWVAVKAVLRIAYSNQQQKRAGSNRKCRMAEKEIKKYLIQF